MWVVLSISVPVLGPFYKGAVLFLEIQKGTLYFTELAMSDRCSWGLLWFLMFYDLRLKDYPKP